MWWFRKTNVFKEEIHESAIHEINCLYTHACVLLKSSHS